MSAATMQSDLDALAATANAKLTSKLPFKAGTLKLDDVGAPQNFSFAGSGKKTELARLRLNMARDVAAAKKSTAVSGPWPINVGSSAGIYRYLQITDETGLHYNNVRFLGKGVRRGRTETRIGFGNTLPSEGSRTQVITTGQLVWRIYAPADADIVLNGYAYCSWYKWIGDSPTDQGLSGGVMGFSTPQQIRMMEKAGRDLAKVSFAYQSEGVAQPVGALAFIDTPYESTQHQPMGVMFLFSNVTVKASEYIEIGITINPYTKGTAPSDPIFAYTNLATHLNEIDLHLGGLQVSGSAGIGSVVTSDYYSPAKANQLARVQVDELTFPENFQNVLADYVARGLHVNSITAVIECDGDGCFYANTPPISSLGCDPRTMTGTPQYPKDRLADMALGIASPSLSVGGPQRISRRTYDLDKPTMDLKGYPVLDFWADYPTPYPPASKTMAKKGKADGTAPKVSEYDGRACYQWSLFKNDFSIGDGLFKWGIGAITGILANIVDTRQDQSLPRSPAQATAYHLPAYPMRKVSDGDCQPFDLEYADEAFDAIKCAAIYSVTARRAPVIGSDGIARPAANLTNPVAVQFGCFIAGTFTPLFSITIPVGGVAVTEYPAKVIVFDDTPLFWSATESLYVYATIARPSLGYDVTYPIAKAHRDDTQALLTML